MWDLIPVDNDMRFYIVSNADSRAPNEMLFLNDPGGLQSWPFQEDVQAQWFLKRAPVPKSCYEEPWWGVPLAVGYGVFGGGGLLVIMFLGFRNKANPDGTPFIPQANSAPYDVADSQREAFGIPSSSVQLPLQGEASGNFPTTTLYHANSFQLPSSSVQPPLRGEASGSFPMTTSQYAYPASFQRGSA